MKKLIFFLFFFPMIGNCQFVRQYNSKGPPSGGCSNNTSWIDTLNHTFSWCDNGTWRTGISISGSNLNAGQAVATNSSKSLVNEPIRYADQFAGADPCAKMNAAMVDLPNTGGIVDARGFQGVQTACASDTFNGITKKVKLILGSATFLTNVNWTLPSNDMIECLDSPLLTGNTIIKANGVLTRLIDGTNSLGVTIRGCYLDGNGVAGIDIDLDNSSVGTVANNVIENVKLGGSTSIAISTDNNGGGNFMDIKSGGSNSGIFWHYANQGGDSAIYNLNATNSGELLKLSFQNFDCHSCKTAGYEIIDNSFNMNLFGGQAYSSTAGADPQGSIFIDAGKWLQQLNSYGTFYILTNITNHVIDGVIVRAILFDSITVSNSSAGNPTFFGSTFASIAGSPNQATVLIYGGNLSFSINKPSFNLPVLATARIIVYDFDDGTAIQNYDTGAYNAAAYKTTSNCSSTTSPAVCSSAAAGNFVIAAATTFVIVNTTAVTANSQIILTEDSSLGTKLGVTCNTQSLLVLGVPKVTARIAATSFTAAIEVGPTTNPLCISYSIVN